MEHPKVGDYIIGNNSIFEITKCYYEGLTRIYDIVELTNPADFLDDLSQHTEHVNNKESHGLGLNTLRHLGKIVNKEEAIKAIEVLFKN